jgi:hypothetical protein
LLSKRDQKKEKNSSVNYELETGFGVAVVVAGGAGGGGGTSVDICSSTSPPAVAALLATLVNDISTYTT